MNKESFEDAFIHPTAIIEVGATIGDGTRIWHYCHVMERSRIGNNCSMGQNVFVGNDVVLGNNVKIQNNVSLYSGVVCEDDVFLGPSMIFTNVINPRSKINRRGEYLQTLVRKGASVGAGATIICGNEIGEYAFVGAGAMVTKNIPCFALVLGNPARQVGWMSRAGSRLVFGARNQAKCPVDGKNYEIDSLGRCRLLD